MTDIHYPLGHTSAELMRLDKQAVLLNDPYLNELAATANTCLEIGCGHGSNLPLLRQSNPELQYTGIDISSAAIHTANSRFHYDVNADFIIADAHDLGLNKRYDLIFTKLVLWSVGPSWRDILVTVKKLLKPGGTFYALEPCNQLIQFYPPKPMASHWMTTWDQAAMQRGLNPHIGKEVASALISADFSHVNIKFFPVLATGNNHHKYMNIIHNLHGFYMGPAAHYFDLNQVTKRDAEAELLSHHNENFVMDGLFAAWGSKRHN